MMQKSITVAVTAALALAGALCARPSLAIDFGVSVTVAPPVLPVYEQPAIPEPGYIWTPGYWAYSDSDAGYYWVPGTWVEPPEEGLLWTPGYWGWEGGNYLWHGGYWGPTIGFYGGVNYGYGYFGHGYDGGYWEHGAFRYNRAYNHFGNDVHVTNVYNRTVINNVTVNRVSYNGGHGGIQARADAREMSAEHEHHVEPISAQSRQAELARGNPALRASENHGRPGIAATSRPGDFESHVVAAHGAPAHPQGNQGEFNHASPGVATHEGPATNQTARPSEQHVQSDNQGNAPRANEPHANEPHANEQRFQNTAPQPAYHAPAPPVHSQEQVPQQHFNAPPQQQHVNAPPPPQQQHINAPPTPPQQHAPAPPQQHEQHAPAPPQQHEQHAPAPPQQHEQRGPQEREDRH